MRSEAVTRGSMHVYDDVLVPRVFEPWANLLLDHLGVTPGETVLDVACGPGSVARLAAARVGPSGRVVACDVSRAMLAIARAKPPLEQSAALEYIECSADSLGVPDDVFDVVSCQQGLQFFPNRPAALDEMRRSTRRAGRVGSAVWCAIEDCPIFSAVAMALGAVLGDETEAAYRSGPWGLPDGAELGDLVEGAGFVDVRVTRHRLPVVFEGGPEQLLETVATTPAAARVAELDAEQRRALERALGEAAAPMMRNGAVYYETASHIARGCS